MPVPLLLAGASSPGWRSGPRSVEIRVVRADGAAALLSSWPRRSPPLEVSVETTPLRCRGRIAGSFVMESGTKRGVMRILCVPSEASGFKPAVPAKCLRQRGNLRGTWYIPCDALAAYNRNLPTPGMKDDGEPIRGVISTDTASGKQNLAARCEGWAGAPRKMLNRRP